METMESLLHRLGFQDEARLLIIHADDLGMTQSCNAAIFDGFRNGVINSASVMPTCPHIAEVATYFQDNPSVDIGVHLTLTGELPSRRWKPVLPREKIPTLVDSDGFLHASWTEAMQINPTEVDAELRAQIDYVYSLGIQPTHLDSHQFKLYRNGNQLFEVFFGIAQSYGLPMLIAKSWFSRWNYLERYWSPTNLILEEVITIKSTVDEEQWDNFYTNAIRNLPIGISQINIHPAYDNQEMRMFYGDYGYCGAEWRQRDLDTFVGYRVRQVLKNENITLINWQTLNHLWRRD